LKRPIPLGTKVYLEVLAEREKERKKRRERKRERERDAAEPG